MQFIFIVVSPYEGSIGGLRMQNNFHPLHFHQVHGDNIKLMKNGTVACRHEGFCKGIAFSDRPVLVGEPVYIKFIEISSNWSGALRIGFTMNDPISMKSKLPRYACPDLTSINGNWAKAIAERMAQKDSILFYYVDQNGDVHYGIDSEEHGIFFGGVNTSEKLWAVLDIYGNTTAVEFIEPRSSIQDFISESDHNIIPVNSDFQLSHTENSFIVGSRMSFHTTHGKNAVLKRYRLVASRKKGSSNLSYVFTDRPLNIKEKLQIKVINIEPQASGTFNYGITSCNPSSLLPDELPPLAEALVDRLEYWVVRNDTNAYKIHDIITFSINEEGEVQVLKNSVRSSRFHVDSTLPLWVFLNLSGIVSEVRIIGSPDAYECDITDQFGKLTVTLPSNIPSMDEIAGPSSEDTNSDKICVVCFEELANCALYRCGHVCMCYDCAHKMWNPGSNVQCPICREPIRDVIKIYT
nr:protein neuralized [Parasteatoda tepidariorum]